MGILDRDYAQERIRKLEKESQYRRRAWYDPKQHRSRGRHASSHAADQSASGPRRPQAGWAKITFWTLLLSALTFGLFQLFLDRDGGRRFSFGKTPPVVMPAPVSGVATGSLRINADRGVERTTVVLTSVLTKGSWTFQLSGGQAIDYRMPQGDYRVRMTSSPSGVGRVADWTDLPEAARFSENEGYALALRAPVRR